MDTIRIDKRGKNFFVLIKKDIKLAASASFPFQSSAQPTHTIGAQPAPRPDYCDRG
jgi:hypothetical protein